MKILDPATFAVLMGMASTIAALVLLAVWRVNRHMAGVRWWAAAGALGALGLLSTQWPAPGGTGPDQGMLLSSGLLFSALLLMLEGSLRFTHRHSALRWQASLVLVPVFVLLNWWYQDDVLARRIFHDTVCALVLLACAFAMLRQSGEDERVVHSLSAFFLMGMALAVGARAMVASQVPDLATLQRHPVHGLTFLVLLLFVMGWTYSVHMACYVRAQRELGAAPQGLALPGLGNRSRMAEMLGQDIARGERTGVHFSYLLIDIHGFRALDGEAGRASPEELRQAFGDRLLEFTRDADFSSHLGENQFAVLLHHTPSQDHLRGAVSRLRHLLARPLLVRQQPIQVDVNLGMAMWPTDGHSRQALEAIALQRLQAEKFSMFKPYVQSEGLRTG